MNLAYWLSSHVHRLRRLRADCAVVRRGISRRRGVESLPASVETLEDRVLLTAVSITPYEQLLLEFVNRARLDPVGELAFHDGLNSLNQGITPGSISSTPKQPLAPEQILTTLALGHTQDMLTNNFFSHTGSDGRTFGTRVTESGYPFTIAGENISRGGIQDPATIDPVQLVIDRHSGLFTSTSGHRESIMDDEFREIGIGIRYGSYVKNSITFNGNYATEDFGNYSGDAAITGVVYLDGAVTDDDFYSVGEQVASGTITATSSGGQVFTTMIGPSGGYAVRVPNGTYTVVASGGGITGTYTFTNIVVANQRNEKVDVDTSQLADPPAGTPDSIVGILSDNRIFVAKSDGSGFTNSHWATVSSSTTWSDFVTGDFDGDGDEDIAGRNAAGYWTTWLADGDHFTAETWGGRWSPNVTWGFVRVGDFNGDGKADIAGRAESGSWYVNISNGNGFTPQYLGAFSKNVTWSAVNTGDFNADGKADIVGRASSGTWVILQSQSGGGHAGLVAGAWSKNVTWSGMHVGDFNMDGRTDVIGRAESGSLWVGLSNGNGFDSQFVGVMTKNATWSDINVGDFNGDGSTDLIARTAGGVWYTWLSNDATTATGFRQHFGIAWSASVSWLDVQIGDFDGDGTSDIAGRGNGSWVVALSSTNVGFVGNSVWTVWNPSSNWQWVDEINVG